MSNNTDSRPTVEIVPNTFLKIFFMVNGIINMGVIMFRFAACLQTNDWSGMIWALIGSLAWWVMLHDLYHSKIVRVNPIKKDAETTP